MSNRPGAWQQRSPPRRPRIHRQACPGMRQGFCMHNRIRAEEEPGEEEVSPHLVDHPIIQWPHRVSLTTLWGPLGQMDHLQHLAPEACYGGLVVAQRHHQG